MPYVNKFQAESEVKCKNLKYKKKKKQGGGGKEKKRKVNID